MQPNHVNNDWTPERTDALMALWSKGLSASAIAREIGGSRNAIIGKVHRLGLTGRKTIVRKPTDHLPRPRARRRMVRLDYFRASTLETATEPEITDLPPDQSDCAVSLEELAEQHCRWPIGDPADMEAFRYCGARHLDDGPYCARHCRIAYQPPRERPRRPIR